jgi:hypothetical protein
LQIVSDIEKSKELFAFLVEKLAERSGQSPKDIRSWFKSAKDSKDALGLAKKVDEYLGAGTFRKLSFVSKGADASRNVIKILSKDLRSGSFEGQAEKGLYLNIKENYGVEWGLEKTARDVLQNFFDGNNQTLDGVEISVSEEESGEGKKVSIKIKGGQSYDWRELVHLGGSTKTESEITAGGFGEGTKILSLILLRDYKAKKVRFSSGDWELDFYIDKVPEGSYRNQNDQGLFVKKRKRKPEEGNVFEMEFDDEKAPEKAKAIESARELFYSTDNPDFQNPSFERRDTGGFAVLPKPKDFKFGKTPKGNLYIAGQRIHFESRDKWRNIDCLNIWTWKKVAPKDRDRGMVTADEVKKSVVPLIVDSMSLEDMKKSVRDFEDWYEQITWSSEPNYMVLEAIVNRLAQQGVKMEFKKDLLANDTLGWIKDLLKQQGYKMCPQFMEKIGMTTSMEQFMKLQEPIRLSETETERKKIGILQEAMKLMEFPEIDQKDVWVFGAENEKSVFHGMYNPEFFWIAREKLGDSFFEALHVYVHEAAHKDGPHGTAPFEYTLQNYIKKVQLFMHDKREEYEKLAREWQSA